MIKFLKEHCEFNNLHDCYVLLAVSRKKDTPSMTNSKEIVFREVIRQEKDIERKLKRLKLNCKNYRDDDGNKYPFYLYITCNARNGKKASKMIMDKITDCLYEESEGRDRSSILKRLDREFVSALMRPKSRGSTRYFMVDVDTKDKKFIEKVEKELKCFFLDYMMIETRNGYHIKSEPFNVKLFNECFTQEELNELVSVERDRLLFVDYIDNGI